MKQESKTRTYLITSTESRWIKADSEKVALSHFKKGLGVITDEGLEVDDLG